MNFDIHEWKDISSTSLSDAMKGLQIMRADIKPLKITARVVGPAYTVQIVDADCAAVFRALRDARPGDVLVIAAQGTMEAAFLGEIIVTIAQTRGLAGIIVDGCIRDTQSISAKDFPVFSKGAVPSSPAINYLSKVQQTVNCGGVVVHPGDFVYGDADGVVIVPQLEKEEVLAKAKAKEKKDLWKLKEVATDVALLEEFLTKACGDNQKRADVDLKGEIKDETYLA